MSHIHFPTIVFSACLALLMPAGDRSAGAQEILKRLEQRVREQLDEVLPQRPADGAAPLPQNPPPPAQGATASPRPSAGETPGGAYLGITGDDREDRGRGVRVLQVRAGGPAAKGGLKEGDLVIGIGDVRIRQMSELAAMLEVCSPGDRLEFVVERDAQQHRFLVTLGAIPSIAAQAAAGEESDLSVAPPLPGIASTEPPTAELRIRPPANSPSSEAFPSPALPAQPASPDGDAQRIGQLETQVRDLSARVEALEQSLFELLQKKN